MDDTPWLDDNEQKAWRTYLWAGQLLQESLDRQLQRESGMPHTYYLILAMLSETPGRSMTMTELSELVRFSASRLSHAVAKLEAAGWVRRRRHPNDGRTTVASLTEDGLATLVAAAPGHVRQVREALFDQLTQDQVRQLREIFDAVLSKLDPADRRGRL